MLIYVFDIVSAEPAVDFKQYEEVIEALDQHSPDARVYVLVHKMDLVAEESRDDVFRDCEARVLAHSRGIATTCFRTSIWDETLYRAWSRIVYSLVPNTALLEANLSDFCRICGAAEVVLFESTTFLVIAHATLAEHADIHRFEKISNIIKQFKLSCRKAQAQFEGMTVRNSRFMACFDLFTSNTCIMVILSDGEVASNLAAIQINIDAAKKHFERFIPRSGAN